MCSYFMYCWFAFFSFLEQKFQKANIKHFNENSDVRIKFWHSKILFAAFDLKPTSNFLYYAAEEKNSRKRIYNKKLFQDRVYSNQQKKSYYVFIIAVYFNLIFYVNLTFLLSRSVVPPNSSATLFILFLLRREEYHHVLLL